MSVTGRIVVGRVVLRVALVAAMGLVVARAAPPGDEAAVAWQQVRPGGRTVCGRGGPFAFWARLLSPARLLIYFEGGGFCWDYRSCAPGSQLFKDRVSDADDPAGHGAGILDLSDRRNPFHDWSVLYVPSCTGDVYAGDARVTYRAGGHAVTIQHRGHANAEAALGWVFRQVPHPAQVFVAGCSAGSIGSILHAPRVIERYPDARVTQLGDSLGYLFSRPTDLRTLWGSQRVLPRWIPGVRAIPPRRFTMPRFYDAVAARYPRARFSQVNFDDDAVQRAYWRETGGRPEQFGRALRGNLDAIRAGAPNFRSYLLAGSTHCTLPRAGFYSFRNGGVALRDWVAAEAEGREVPNVG